MLRSRLHWSKSALVDAHRQERLQVLAAVHGDHVARAKLRALAAGAALVREELGTQAPAAASAP